MMIQLALDLLNLEKSLELVINLSQEVDIIEIGTPLLLKYGLSVIPPIKEKLTDTLLVVDTKIVDAGELETELFLANGADLVTVLGGSSDQTVKNALKTARKYRKEIMIDLIDCDGKLMRIEELAALGVKSFCLHRPSDLTRETQFVFPDRENIPPGCKIAVAGGVGLDNIIEVVEYRPDIIIIGSAITKSKEPASILAEIKKTIRRVCNE